MLADTVVADTAIAAVSDAAVSDAAGKAVPAGVSGQTRELYVPGSGERVPAELRLVLAGYVGVACGLFAGALACATALVLLVFFADDLDRYNGLYDLLFGLALTALVGGAFVGAWTGAEEGVHEHQARIRFSRLLRRPSDPRTATVTASKRGGRTLILDIPPTGRGYQSLSEVRLALRMKADMLMPGETVNVYGGSDGASELLISSPERGRAFIGTVESQSALPRRLLDEEMQPPPDRGVDPDGPATDAASTQTDGDSPGWTPPPWSPDAAAGDSPGWTPPPWSPDAAAGDSPGWTPPPRSPDAAHTRPSWKLILAGCLIAAIVLLGPLGWLFDASRSTSGKPEVAPAEPTQVSAEVATPDEIDKDLNSDEYNIDDNVDLRVGDCFNLKNPYAEIEHVKKVPCKTEHEFELFYVGAISNTWNRARPAIRDYLIDYCEPAFSDYIGKAFDDSELDYDWLVPTEDAWRSGDRTVHCAAYDPNNSFLERVAPGHPAVSPAGNRGLTTQPVQVVCDSQQQQSWL